VTDYRPWTYGDSFADVYDDWYAEVSDIGATVDCIAQLAGSRPVLELGVGTGRLARPLAAAGIEVWGVDGSPAMLARLHGAPIRAVAGDMAHLPFGPDQRFGVAFAAYNTFFNLTTEADQAACLREVAAVVRPGGVVAIEAFVPAGDVPDGPGPVSTQTVTLDRVVLAVADHDAAEQLITGQHIELRDGQAPRLRPWRLRYLHPGQLDDLAEAAGLRREYRWADWSGRPFRDDSEAHVTIYRRPVSTNCAETRSTAAG
jgi:SAM-dependent methyltransferase